MDPLNQPLAALPTVYRTIIYQHLIPYVDTLGPHRLEQAWQTFWTKPDNWPKNLLSCAFEPLFVPWFLFHWPYPEEALATQYRHQHKTDLSLEQQRFIDCACASHYRFYQAIETNQLKDVLNDQPTIPWPNTLAEGDLLFASFLDINAEPLLLSAFPQSFPSETLHTLSTLIDRYTSPTVEDRSIDPLLLFPNFLQLTLEPA